MNRYYWHFLFLFLLFPQMEKCQAGQERLGGDSTVNLQPSSLLNSDRELPLTLAEAVYLALENNRDLKIAYLQRILDKKQLAEVESVFNPTITPQLGISFNNNQIGSIQNNNTIATLGANFNWNIPTGANISLVAGETQLLQDNSLNNSPNIVNQAIFFNFSQPLLKGFGTQVNSISIQKSRLTEQANALNFKNTKAQLITNAILSYRNLLLAQESLKINQIAVESSKKDLERLQALFEFGRIPKNDLIERQAQIAQQEVNLLNTQSNLDQAITTLTQTLDLPVPKKLIAIETPAPPTNFNLPAYAQLLELAKANSNSYLTALNSVENAKLNIIDAKQQQQWDLKFNVSYGLNTASNAQYAGNFNSFFTLSREFGNLSLDNAVEKSQVSLQSANLTLENTRRNIEEDLKTKIRNVEDTFRQIKLAQDARELAETNVINAKERQRLGMNINMTDIINFEKNLVIAKNQELNAIINHLNSVTIMEQFLGITLNKWVKE